MSDYRRVRIPGGTYFFTVNLLDRRSGLLVERIEFLREAVASVRIRHPFHIDAWVILPDHMHAIWTMPADDSDYAGRWRAIKTVFSKFLPSNENLSPARARNAERGVWQRRYWEHTIRDERDYASHLDYVHLNPYKHGLVTRVKDWPYSSFHRYVAEGIYPQDWLADVEEMQAGER